MYNLDRDYYRRRLAQEAAAAQNTSCEQSRGIHSDLAERYGAKLRLIDGLTADSSIVEPDRAAKRADIMPKI